MRIREIGLDSNARETAARIAEVHIEAFPEFFLTKLGDNFLTELYFGYIEDSQSGLIVAENDDAEILGFVAYSKNYSEFFHGLLRRHILEFATSSIRATLKHPSFSRRLLGAFHKSGEVKREEAYVELASIAVKPSEENKGLGSLLIQHLIGNIDFNDFAYISLETDAINNEAANKFYQKNGFRLAREYATAEGRQMNEYRYGEKNVRKRVAIITLAVALQGEKGYSRFWTLANMLASKYDVDLITSSFQHWEKKQRDKAQITNVQYPFRILIADEPGYRKNVDPMRMYSHKIAVNNILKILGENPYDLIYCIIPPNNMAARVGDYAREHNIKYIVDVEDLWPEAMEMISPMPHIIDEALLKGFRTEARHAYACADAIVGTSDEYRDVPKVIYGITGKQAITVYVGCELSEFDSGAEQFRDSIDKNEDEFWVTYAGNLGSSYDISTLVKSAQQIYKSGNNNIKFKILGGGPLEEQLKDCAAEQPCNVEFVGYLPYKEMASWLSKSDVLVNSFVKDAPQSIVTKIGDYLAAGKPMINTLSSPEFREKVDRGGFGVNVPAENVNELVSTILSMEGNRQGLITMGEKARTVAEAEFDRKTSYKRILELVNGLLD